MESKNNKLEKKNIFLLIISSQLNEFGTTIYDYANKLVIASSESKSNYYMRIYQFSEIIIQLLFSLFGGVFADSKNKKKILIFLVVICFIIYNKESEMNFEKIQYIERKTGEIRTEKVMGEGALKFLYYNPFGKLALHTIVKRKFLSDWYGRKMSKPESKEKIKSFVEEMGIDMSEYKRPIEDYTSFNDFFYRELKDGARKIDYNKNVIVSPADGKARIRC